MRGVTVGALVLIAACGDGKQAVDADGDGHRASKDCDDRDDRIFPGARDIPYDGIDQDCDGSDLVDVDEDGFVATEAGGDDCDDRDASTYPGAVEVWYDGVDGDCDGGSDFDQDGDGYDITIHGGDDCDDMDPLLTPRDADGDGFSTCDGDCDDADAASHPGAVPVCGDGLDNDCDGLADCGLDGVLPATHAAAELYGEAGGDDAGGAVAAAGDVDGDGFGDLLIGAPGRENVNPVLTEWGLAYLVRGPVSGERALVDADARIMGDYLHIATSLTGVGDLDGDGLGEILIGAPNGGSAVLQLNNGAYLFRAPSGQLDASTADATLRGEHHEDLAGFRVAAAGDQSGDARADLLIGAPGQDMGAPEAGLVYVTRTPVVGLVDLADTEARLVSDRADSHAGYGLADAGDMSGDGIHDSAVGAPGPDFMSPQAGTVFLLYGPHESARLLSSAEGVLDGEQAGDFAGGSVAPAGDVDGDGARDVLVGAPGHDANGPGAGAAYLVRGGTLGDVGLAAADVRLLGAGEGDLAGSSVTAGDLDGDGTHDLLVGAIGAASGAGALYVVYGPVSGTIDLSTADGVLEGIEAGDMLGASAAMVNDTNGDGTADLLVGAPGRDTILPAGAAFLVLGGSP